MPRIFVWLGNLHADARIPKQAYTRPTMKKLLFVGAAIAITGAGCFSSPAPTPSGQAVNNTPTAPIVTPNTQQPPMMRVTVDPNEKTGASILPQSAGNEITIAFLRMEKQGFVTVHADENGKPGKLLGQSELLFAGENTQVPIRVKTAASTSYWIELRLDTGDKKLNEDKDLIAKNNQGGPVQYLFKTLEK